MKINLDYDSLHPLERKLLPHLRNGAEVEELVIASGMSEVEVVRALQWLASKGMLTINEKTHRVVTTGENLRSAISKGLPEYRFLKLLDGKRTVPEIQQYFTIDEFNAALGILKKREAIAFGSGKVQKTSEASVMLREEKDIIEFLEKANTTPYDKLDKKMLDQFRARKGFLSVHEKTERTVTLTTGFNPKGIKHEELLEQVTPEVMKNKSYKDVRFRRYDINAFVPQQQHGKTHFLQEATEEVRKIWLSMGFSEMEGAMVQTAFWDLDALFVPQDHPAREMQDTLYVKGTGKLPKEFVSLVRQAHEKGVDGSEGWGYQYSEQEAKKLLLRTHCTVLTAQTLARLTEKDLPAKFFSIGKVFRNETIDWKHLAEFHQIEGIVVGDVTLQDLIGLQKIFYEKLGFPRVRFRPAYFPYTEPSCEVEVWLPEREEWIEIGGMGMIRPEVIAPLMGGGKLPKKTRVLAWGLGLERIVTIKYGIKDLRQLYTADIKQLKNTEVWK